MCAVANADFDPDPNPRGEGGHLPNPNECNSTLVSATRVETLTRNECNSTLLSGTSGGASPTYIYRVEEGVNYLILMSAVLC